MQSIVNKRSFTFLLLTLLSAILLVGCTGNDQGETEKQPETNDGETEVQKQPENEVNSNEHVKPVETDAIPTATLTMENDGVVVIELYPNIATNTVNNFITLAQDGFYDGLIFHRVIPGFMIQGGDPSGNGTGGPGYSIKGEFSKNKFENDLKHERGVISMARSGHPDSAGSQFFITTDDSEFLDGEYAAFGKVTEGMDVVDEIVQAETGANDKPKQDQIIRSITIDLNGYEVEDPVKVGE